MAKVKQHGIMTTLVEDLELSVLKTPPAQKNVSVSGEDLLILIAYTRQLESVIKMMDTDPAKAKDVMKY